MSAFWNKPGTFYRIVTSRACGALLVNSDGVIVDSASYYKFLRGKYIMDIWDKYEIAAIK